MRCAITALVAVSIIVLFAASLILEVMAQLSGHNTTIDNPNCLNLFGFLGKCPPAKVSVDLGLNLSVFQMAHHGG
jgi:hypothetical protein